MKMLAIGLLLATASCAHIGDTRSAAGKAAEEAYLNSTMPDTCYEGDDAKACERQALLDFRACGPNGSVSADENGIVCDTDGWDWRKGQYVAFCDGKKAFPSRHDPWLRSYMRLGESLKNAQIGLSDDRTNSCK